ncbi:DUF423 domain-containing protein [Phaeodactylibacter luteus]|uniref:DUF423 domain-containing protein n=1 Tax=Phaeodactylibacter luteus TaxID=1564516 RepID=A0A5C6RL51_9BACT|nr:DUF423 domain-containing protein [Phaeodactylibacter luteus]TXB62973.1 DUF423 domain-containing protein [Phaeodactylibacter luteus]
MRKTFLRLGSLAAMTAVMLGAFGAHALKAALSPEALNTFEIGVRYQFYHALGLIAIGLLLYWRKTNLLHWGGWLFTAGILAFSGSLYLLSARELLGLDVSWIGPVTPIGGVFFIAGWGCLLFATFQDNQKTYRKKHSEN